MPERISAGAAVLAAGIAVGAAFYAWRGAKAADHVLAGRQQYSGDLSSLLQGIDAPAGRGASSVTTTTAAPGPR